MPRLRTHSWSRFVFPIEHPRRSDFTLWKAALVAVVPAGGINDSLGPFLREGHKQWDWTVHHSTGLLVYHGGDDKSLYRCAGTQQQEARGESWELVEDVLAAPISPGVPCSVRRLRRGGVRIISEVTTTVVPDSPEDIIDVLRSWGHTWMWECLKLFGGTEWLLSSIASGTCVAVTDGSYMRDIFPNLGSAAFVLECTTGQGRIIGAFSEQACDASAFRSELLGLLAIHLVLLAANRLQPNLGGRVDIFSDCLGALGQVFKLPTDRIPARCKHGDILKLLMLQCRDLTFGCRYNHVRAHQDEIALLAYLSRPAQLNCYMDGLAKTTIWSQDPDELPRQDSFPLEPVAVYINKQKITSGKGEEVHFGVHKILAEEVFYEQGILCGEQFHAIAWREVYEALHEVPEMFQKWACKQVLDIAATNCNLAVYKEDHDPRCPSCEDDIETTGHILCCREVGRVEALQLSISLLDDWLAASDTAPALRRLLVSFARGRGRRRMSTLVEGMADEWKEIGRAHDTIGWRRFMEGMIPHRIRAVQRDYLAVVGSTWTVTSWMKGLVVKLLEVTHGQWLYRNIQVHDQVAGALASKKKEDLRAAIEEVIGGKEEELADDDKWLLEVNLGDLEVTSGEEQEYWMLAVKVALKSRALGTGSRRRCGRNRGGGRA